MSPIKLIELEVPSAVLELDITNLNQPILILNVTLGYKDLRTTLSIINLVQI